MVNLKPHNIKEKFTGFNINNTDGENAKIIIKYYDTFTPATWLITEGEIQPDGDVLMYGYCYINCGEWGEVYLSELERLGHRIKKDENITTTVKEEKTILGI